MVPTKWNIILKKSVKEPLYRNFHEIVLNKIIKNPITDTYVQVQKEIVSYRASVYTQWELKRLDG